MLKTGHPDFKLYDISQFNIADFNYFSVDISILCPSTNLSYFIENISSLHQTCFDPEHVEILVKLDADTASCKDYVSLLNSTKFRWKILMYSKGRGRSDLHVFYDDLAKLSFGRTVWLYNDFLCMNTKNWDQLIRSYRNCFSDNVYILHVNGVNVKKTRIYPAFYCPLMSQEFYQRLGMISINRRYAEFLNKIGDKLGRTVYRDDISVRETIRKDRSVSTDEHIDDDYIARKVKECFGDIIVA